MLDRNNLKCKHIPQLVFCGMLFIVLSIKYTPILAQEPVFKNGEQVCFVGNSITNHGHFYHDIALFYATRFPTQNINIINCGVSGNTAANVIKRMDGDVLVYDPNWAVVKLGMNDVHKELYTKQASATPGINEKRAAVFEVYKKDYEVIIQTLLKSHAKIILQTPTIYDQTASIPANEKLTGRNDALKIYAGYVKELGKKYGFPVVDYWTIMNDITQKVQAVDSTATIIGADRVHPGPVGHFIMAYQFLKTTTPSKFVSQINVSANKGGGAQPASINANVTDVKIVGTGLSFTCLENSLPYPSPQGTAKAYQLVPFIDEFDHEDLKVKNLQPGKYQLKIDDIVVGTYSASEFNDGINLSQNKTTPQYQQASKVLTLFEQYWKLEAGIRYIKGMEFGRLGAKSIYTYDDALTYFDKAIKSSKDTTTATYKNLISFRDSYLPGKKKQPETDASMQSIHNEIYRVNQPVPHRFELIKL